MSKKAKLLDHSKLEGQTFAAIDLGSNSFHLIVARYDHGTLHVIDRIKEMVRLAEGVGSDGSLSDEVRDRALDCLARFGQRISNIPNDNIRAVGTNAFRRIKDGWKFLAKAESRLDHPIEIISGQEEARLIYLGVAHGISVQGKRRLVIDIGGGSTEFIIGKEFKPIELDSLYFGCVGIAQKFFSNGKITAKRWNKAKTMIKVELQGIAAGYLKIGWEEALGSSGTMRAVRDVLVSNGWSERGITLPALEQLYTRLLDFGNADQIDLIGLSERRRPVFASGAVIIQACMETLNIEQIIVAEYALREGLLYDMVGRVLQADPREASIGGLMQKYRVDTRQVDRVKACALNLWHQTAVDWNLPPQSEHWLRWACSLHEIGLTISHHGYQRHGSYVIEHSDLLGFSKLEQSILAKLVMLHRRKPPVETLDDLIRRVQRPTAQIAALLRIAVLLSRTRMETALPKVKVSAESERLKLRLSDKWSDAHPLTQADLEQEIPQLAKLGVDLVI